MDIKQDIIKRLGPDVKVNKNLKGCYEYTFSRISAAVFRISNIDIIGWHIGDLVCVAEDSRLFANEIGATLPEDCKVVGTLSGISDNPKQLFITIPLHDNFDDRSAFSIDNDFRGSIEIDGDNPELDREMHGFRDYREFGD